MYFQDPLVPKNSNKSFYGSQRDVFERTGYLSTKLLKRQPGLYVPTAALVLPVCQTLFDQNLITLMVYSGGNIHN